MKQLLSAIIFPLFIGSLSAQSYSPVDTANQTVRTQASKEYLNSNKIFKSQIKSEYSGSNRTNILTHYEKVHKQFNEDLLKGDYLFDQRFCKMIDRIVAELKSKNKEIPDNIKFYLSRDLALNASCMGDNNFVMNLGTFYYLENEEQLASIIAHEMGHLLLKHSAKSIQLHYLTMQEEARKQVKAVKQEKINKSEKAWSKLKQILYEESRYNRKQEYEADSIGFVLFRNTDFHPVDYINTLKLMDQYDSVKPMGLKTETYKRIFDLPSQPFKAEWLKQEDFKSYDYSKYKAKIDKDSVDTHPKTEERIASIKRIFPELGKQEESAKATTGFTELQKLAKADQPACLNYQEEYGAGIYLCLLRLQQDDKDLFYQHWLGDFFTKIYDARKRYTLNRYLERIDPKEQSESYQQFLSFMWNLKLNEIKSIADYYNKKGS